MKTKAKSQKQHFQRRAVERFGVILGPNAIENLIRQIQSGEAKFVEKQSNRVSVFTVTLESGQQANAVYDRQRKNLVTLLPVEWKICGGPLNDNLEDD